MTKLRFFLVFAILLEIIACARISPGLRKDNAYELAISAGFSPELIQASEFKLQTFSRNLQNNAEELVIYMEGDGLAWRRKNKISSDPTPVSPLALQLAIQDPSEHVLYIARPCQFLTEDDLANCHPRYWTSHRYAEEVLQSIDEVIDEIKTRTNFNKFKIVGYSGGGVIATLLAATREDIAVLVTVAANLDHFAWTKHHSVSPLTGSLNPIDYRKKLQTVSQLHFVGDEDEIVPSFLAEEFLDRMDNGNNIHLEIVSGFDHQCCWVAAWPDLLKDAESILSGENE